MSTRRPSTATSPSTVTRPSSIRSSQTRRLPNPARARTFWRRSPSGSSGVGFGVTLGVLGAVRPWREVEIGAQRIVLVGQAQALLEGFDDLGAGHELASGGRSVERVEAEPLEESGVVP